MSTVEDRYYIYIDDKPVGVLEYVDRGDEVEIKYIKIHKELRRAGLATRVINYFKEQNKVIIGDALPEALNFWASVNASFYKPFKNDSVVLTPFIINN